MSLANQLTALVSQRDQLALTVASLGCEVPDQPTFKEINDALRILSASYAPAYAAAYTDYGGEWALVFGRLADGESIPSTYPSMYSEGTSLNYYKSYTDFEDIVPASASDIPWKGESASITSVTFLNGIYPESTAYWFNNMFCLESITGLEKLDASDAVSTAYMFAGCEYISELDFSSLNNKNASNVIGMFDDMTRLERITVGNNFSFTGNGSTSCALPSGNWQALSDGSVYTEAEITDGMAETYTRLPESYASVYTDYNGEYVLAFGKAIVPPATYVSDAGKYYWQTSGACWTGIEEITPEWSSDVPWCDYASSITNVVFIDEITPKSINLWFLDMTKCASMDLAKLNTSKLTSMASMFDGCTGLTSLDVSNFDTSGVTDINFMFGSCRSLTSIDVSNFDTSKVADMEGMFYGCSKLTTIYASDRWSTAAVAISSNMFAGCTKLKGDIAYNNSYTDKTYAKTSGGYLTYKAV